MAERLLLRFSELDQVVLNRANLLIGLSVNLLAANGSYKSLILETPG